MQYYILKTVAGDFPAIVQRVIASLKTEGFGVLTEIDVKATIKQKRNIDFRDYRILGACNHPLAHQALTADDKIGTMGTSEQRGLAIVRGIGAFLCSIRRPFLRPDLAIALGRRAQTPARSAGAARVRHAGRFQAAP